MQVDDRYEAFEEISSVLSRVPFFEGLPEEDLAAIARTTQRLRVDDGEYVFREGEIGDALFIVSDGGVDLTVAEPAGDMELLTHRGSGEPFGETALLSGTNYSASARARGETSVLRIDANRFQDLLTDNRIALRVLASISRALHASDVRRSAENRLDSGEAEVGLDIGELSRRIQRGLLPREAPRIKGFDIAAGTSLADGGMGRTVWDHFTLKDGRTGLASLSVQGDGLPPGHYLAVTRSLLRELARDHDDLKGLLARVNSGLASSVIEGMEQYVEAGILLPSDGGVEWAGAGRCPGAVIRRDGVFQEFTTHGPPLGMLDGFLYGTLRMELGAGDAVIVLSDASQGIFRGAADLVSSLQGKPVGEIVTLLQKALRKARPDTELETSVVFVRRQ